jgi:hypothetical protein
MPGRQVMPVETGVRLLKSDSDGSGFFSDALDVSKSMTAK